VGRDKPAPWFQGIQGAHKACVYEHLGFGFLFDESLTSEGLGRFPVVCLPNVGILSEREVALLRRYVEDGGNLVITGHGGQFDPGVREHGEAIRLGEAAFDERREELGLHAAEHGSEDAHLFALADERLGGGGVAGGATTSSSIPVTPTTPTAFEMRPVGVRMEVDPVIGENGSIDLNLLPEVTEFDGFINYGSPIYSVTPATGVVAASINLFTGALIPGTAGSPSQKLELTPNIINQPIFSTRKVKTSVTVWDGQTVALGGLIREDVQDVEDKLPVMGDLPFIGRLFRTEVEDHFKRNLMIFVTATLIDPAGQRITPNSATDGGGVDGSNPLLPSIGN
jgi:hypothetical protein